eukprot:SAG31_NODE_1387_length_8554_cov_14.239148_5_plen_93_part_00
MSIVTLWTAVCWPRSFKSERLSLCERYLKLLCVFVSAGTTWSAESLLSDGSFSYMTGAHDRQRLLSNGRVIITIHGHNGPAHVSICVSTYYL